MRKWTNTLFIIGCILLFLPAIVQANKAVITEGLHMEMGSATIYVESTVPEPEKQTAIIPFIIYFDEETHPLPSGTISSMETKIFYDATYLNFQTAYKNDIKWTGDFEFDHDPATGIITLTFTAGQASPSLDPYTFAFMEFTAKCQPELTENELIFNDPYNDSYLYILRPDMLLDKYVPEKLESGFVNIDDYRITHSIEQLIPEGGILGKQITVPIYYESNSLLAGSYTFILFDKTRLSYVDAFAENPDLWPVQNDFEIGFGDIYDTIKVKLLSYYTDPAPQAGSPEILYNIIFDVLTPPAWDDQSTDLQFLVDSCYAIIPGIYNYCSDLIDHYELVDGSISVENYTADFQTVVDDMIWQADIDNTWKLFNADVKMLQNFTCGGDDNRIIFNYNLGEDIRFQDVYEPGPGEDFKFAVHTSTSKATTQRMSVRQQYDATLDNERDAVESHTFLTSFSFMLNNIEPLTSYDDTRYIAFPYSTDYDGNPDNYSRVEDFTGTAKAEPMDASMTWDLPQIKYAVGELYCANTNSTRPHSVNQSYYIRNSFPVTDFYIKVNKMGSNHSIVGITAGQGVDIFEYTEDYVIFVNGDDWNPEINNVRQSIGSIEYNLISAPIEVDDPVFGVYRDIGPGPEWCWKYTDIEFDESSYLHDASGRDPQMIIYNSTIGTRWECGGVIVNPGEDIIEPTKAETLPKEFKLYTNYPNPFNPATTIAFDLPKGTKVKLEIYNILGQKVETLIDGFREAGRYEVNWDASKYSSGIYLYRFVTDEYQRTEKMILMK